MKSSQIHISIDETNLDMLKKLALEKSLSISSMARSLLVDKLKESEK